MGKWEEAREDEVGKFTFSGSELVGVADGSVLGSTRKSGPCLGSQAFRLRLGSKMLSKQPGSNKRKKRAPARLPAKLLMFPGSD